MGKEITDDCQFLLKTPPSEKVFGKATLDPCDYILQTAQETPSYYTQELVVNVAGNGKADETNVQLYTNPTVSSSQWTLAKIPTALPMSNQHSNKYTLENKGAPKMYLNLAGGGAHGKTNVQLYNGASNPDNQWSVFKVANSGTPGPAEYVIQGSDGSYLTAASNVMESNVKVGSDVGMRSRWHILGIGTCSLKPADYDGPKELPNGDGKYKIYQEPVAGTKIYLGPKAGGVMDGTNVLLGAASDGFLLKKDEVTNEYLIRYGPTVGKGYLSKCSTSPECTNVNLGGDSSLGKWLVYESRTTAGNYVFKSTQGWYYLSGYGSTAGDNVHVSVMTGGMSEWKLEHVANR